MYAKKMETLGALAAGCAAGWMLCWATACGSAKADTPMEPSYTTTTVQCVMVPTTGGTGAGMAPYAVLSLQGVGASDVAARVIASAPVYSSFTINGSPVVSTPSSVQFLDGAAAVQCNKAGDSVSFVVR